MCPRVRDTIDADERAMDDPKDAPKGTDVVLLHSPTDDGQGVRVLRAREGRIEAGELRPALSGRPLHGDLVKLKPRQETPLVCDVEVTYAAERPPQSEAAPRKTHPGPAKVATQAYRKSWDRIFGKKSSDESAPRKKEDLN